MFLSISPVTEQRWDTLAWHYYGDPLGYPGLLRRIRITAITPVLPSGVVVLIPVIDAGEADTRRILRHG